MKRQVIALAMIATVAAVTHTIPSAHAGQAYAECSVSDVATFNNRVHLHCTSPIQPSDLMPGGSKNKKTGGADYYAVEVASPMASQVIQIGLAAVTSHRTLGIFYDDNAGANPAGCNTNDCRRLVGVVYK